MNVYFAIIFIFVLLADACQNKIVCKNTPSPHLFSLQSTPTWFEYPLRSSSSKIAMDKDFSAWTSSLTLKSNRPMILKNLKIQWTGNKINHLTAALYQKRSKEFSVIPIQDNLIVDGTWNAQTQQFNFNVNNKVIAVNDYHLIVSFPKTHHDNIKKGRFIVVQTELIDLR